MKNLIPFLLSFSLFFACVPDEPGPRFIPEPCNNVTTLTAPEGFEIRALASIDLAVSLSEVQFVTNDLGYILASTNAGAWPAILKTEDGGQSWTDLGIDVKKHAQSLFFVDENLGFITLSDNQGCPSNCLYRCFLLKTTDGGQSWEEVEFPNLKGSMHKILADEAGNLYANLYLYPDGSILIKSTDQGQSWDTLYHDSLLKIQLTTFALNLVGNKIYAPTDDHQIAVIDTDGNYLKTLSPNQSNIWDLQVIDDQNLVVSGTHAVISNDGGTNWKPIRESRTRILHFFSPEKGLMIQSLAICPTDVVTLDDIIAFTDDGGTNWFRSELATNTSLHYVNSQLLDNGKLMMLMMNGLYEIEEM